MTSPVRPRGPASLRRWIGRGGHLAAPFVVTVSLAGACGDSSTTNPPIDTEATGGDTSTSGPTDSGTTTPGTTSAGSEGGSSSSTTAPTDPTSNPPLPTSDASVGTDTETDGSTGTGTDTDTGSDSEGGTDTGGFNPADGGVQQCGDAFPQDPVAITSADIVGDILSLGVSYSGGCEEHAFGLCWDGLFLESEPVQVGLTLAHDAMGDGCEAAIQEDLKLDLTALREAYQDAYQTDTGTITLNIAGWMQPVTYSF